MKPLASLSLDLDNQWSYQKTHGDEGWDAYARTSTCSCRWCSTSLAEQRLRITFFVVGQDAALERNEKAIRALAEAGHEIGNHSFRHEPWLHRYSPDEIDEELAPGRGRHRGRHRSAPDGFRGPGLQPVGRRAAGPRRPRLPVRLLDAADGHRAAGARVLLPLGQADGRAARRALLPLRWVPRRSAPAQALPCGRSATTASSRSRSPRCRRARADPRQLPALPRRARRRRWPASTSPTRCALCRTRRRRAVDPAAPARLPRRRRRRRARLLPGHGHDGRAPSGPSSPTASGS